MNKTEKIQELRNLAYQIFKDDEDEKDLDDTYDAIRDEVVCAMSDRADELEIDADTL